MIEIGSDEWYVGNVLAVYERLGWKPEGDPVVKLIHPQGRENFSDCGVVFIDSASTRYPDHFIRVCALFPGQKMPLHHHLERAETFKVVAGTVRAHWESGEMLHVPPGDIICPKIGEKHGVSTDWKGGLYVGICHKSHLTDVHWTNEDALVSPIDRVTLPPLTTDLPLPIEQWEEFRVSESIEKSLEDSWQHSLTANAVESPV